jgi:hypothetical protein
LIAVMSSDEMIPKERTVKAKNRRRLPLPRAFLLVAAVSLALSCAFFAAARGAGRGLYDQRAAEFWTRPVEKPAPTATITPEETETPAAGAADAALTDGGLKTSDMGYSQVSAFFGRGAGFNYISMMRLRQGLSDKYVADGITSPSPEARLWIDAASGTGTATVTGGKNGTASVSVTGILGDFFFFHPMKLLSGQYINPNEASKDYVMLDWNTAWRVFGGYEASGMRVEVGGIPCIVAGVFEKDEGDEAENRIYASFELLEKLTPMAELTSLDFVLSTPITGYGIQAIEGLVTAVPASERVVVENSRRFELASLWDTLGNIGEFTAKTNAVALPYWENAARSAQLGGAVFLLLGIVFAALPALTVVMLLVKLYRRRGLFFPWIVRTAKGITRTKRRAAEPVVPAPEEIDTATENQV